MACLMAAGPFSAQLSSCAARSSEFGSLSARPAPAASAAVPRSFAVRAAGEPSEKSLEVMRKFSEQYARKSDTFFCVDKGVTAVVVKGLAEHKDTLGAPLCPCRHYDDKVVEVQQGFWNCPCVPMRERKECHCMLFLTPDNDFAGTDQDNNDLVVMAYPTHNDTGPQCTTAKISLQEISELTANF